LAEQNDGVALGRLQSRAQLLRQIIAIISKDLDEMGVTDVGTPGEVFEVERWRAKLGKDRELLTRTQSELWTLQLEADAPDRVTKIDADVMSGIEGTRRLKFSAMAAVGILAAGLGVLVWRESRNPRVLNSRQLPGELGLPLIGVLPALRQSHKATLAPATDPNWQVVLGDAVNAARTILQYGVSGPRPARSILVGSALSGEGKTSASLLLARSLAQAGHRTLLIDGDLRHPRIHQALDLPSRVGLCEYLAGAATPTEILQPTGIPELTAIAAGMWSAAGNQGLTTGRWTELVTQAAEQYEYVIIDSAPILPVADTLIMARSVDGVLLSVMRDVSELTPVKETLAQLALIGTRVLGVVMNGGQPAGYYRPRYSPESTPAPPLAS
jgi:capsular exopolysaccharide synthesis family protein